MTRIPVNYSNNLNYKIVCKNTNIEDFYIGRTTDFRNRKNQHKKDCNSDKKNHISLYKCINEHGGWDNWEMVLIEYYSCKNGIEARQREHYLTKELKSTLNKNSSIILDVNDNPIIIDNELSYKERNKLMSNFRNNTNHLKIKKYEIEINRLKQILIENNINF